MGRERTPSSRGTSATNLDRLIELEEAIVRRTREVRAQTEAILESARAEAEEAARTVEHELAAEATRVRETARVRLQRELELVAGERERRVLALEAVTAERLEQLVAFVVGRVMGDEVDEPS